ncbi:MAG: cytochrome C [Chitinophagaceae bacterium BSSC1]|nr:MAG: cytochrome C [Chitinophagaceae bacterium BSSC1]
MFKNRFSIAHWVKAILIVVISIGLGSNDAFAAGPPKASELSNPLAQVLLVIIVGLLLAIGLLANVILGAAQVYLQRFKDERKRSDAAGKTVAVILFCLVSTALFAADAPAADAAAAPAETTIAGLGLYSFYALISVIVLELVILLVLLGNLKKLLSKEAALVASTEVADEPTESALVKWWDNLNKFRPIQEEANIDLGHNYDGIRELDNRLPPWWLYGFYITIIFGCIYIYRYHVAQSAPLSKEELAISMEKAAVEKEEYLKKSANKVDENTVVYLKDAADIDAGKKVFTTVCAACHLNDGGGSVGPNLTDNYWIHGGGIKDIFKTLKYGWPEKGMKSWKDDYTPQQLAQIASYVKSLGGTKPAKAKEPQGVLFEEKAAGADSSKAVSDTTKIAAVVVK